MQFASVVWNSHGPRVPSPFQPWGPLEADPGGKGRPVHALSCGLGHVEITHRPTILNTSCSNGLSILLVQPSVTVSGQNHWNVTELARAYWSPLLYFQADAWFQVCLEDF